MTTPKKRNALPMGEDRDALRDAADRALSGGEPTRRRRLLDDDDDLPLERGYRHAARPYQPDDRPAPRNIFQQGRELNAAARAHSRSVLDPSPSNASGDTWNSPFVKLGGITFTKKQFVAFINDDLPRLFDEAAEQSTVRGRFLRGIFIPAVKEELHRHKAAFAPPPQEDLDL